ncbi:hypothetical protein G7Y89_g14503 [Cudoniella acicularis]|uniref:Kinetochore protein n=1 Tax=Cudoniella acicularis TaxID=354080 RepID=A0A8H4VTL4_9HELO|nr:hypothetical protein G7Y89_g14503 [Cudoniella acicularis]
MTTQYPSPTIIDLKTSFLRTQILALSAPIKPSPTFLNTTISSEENTLRQKNIDDALLKLNGTEKIIEQLPEEWSEEAEEKAPEKAAKFRELQQKLVELNERRREAREKVERYKAFKGLLAPFEEASMNVQENLVVKDGEVERELERMKLLMLRVQRGIGGLERKDGGSDEGEEMEVDVDEESDRKLLDILGMP